MKSKFAVNSHIIKTALIAIICAFSSFTAISQNKIFSIVTCPGANTEKQINVSWGAENKGSYLVYTKKSDKNWHKQTKIEPEERRCTTYDTIYSKTATNENFYEHVQFVKCDASLCNLTADTEYMYKILDDDTQSAIHYFKTSGAKKWSACIISDFHTYTPIPARLEAAMNMIDTIVAFDPGIDWILHLGDICAWGGSYSFWQKLYDEPYFQKYLWAGVNGNHDNMTRKYRLTNEFFRDANFYPRNGYKGEEGVCYHFKYGNALFIMLNNENMRKESELHRAQEWVRKVVIENPAKYIIVCEHYQWFFGNDGGDSQYARWRDLFDELGVDLALAGNNHIYLRAETRQGNVQDQHAGTLCIQTPSSDNERGVAITDSLKHNTDIIKFRWSEGPKTVGALSLKADNKRMIVTLLDRYGHILDVGEIRARR